MGDSHYKSNLKGEAGTETISEFASIEVTGAVTSSSMAVSGAIVGSGAVSGTGITGSGALAAGTYVKIGTKYILTTGFSHTASIVAEATAAVGDVPAGSIALGLGEFWVFTSDNVASMLAQP
jgi:hypothetical protein